MKRASLVCVWVPAVEPEDPYKVLKAVENGLAAALLAMTRASL